MDLFTPLATAVRILPGHPPAVTAPCFPKGPQGRAIGRGRMGLASWLAENREGEMPAGLH